MAQLETWIGRDFGLWNVSTLAATEDFEIWRVLENRTRFLSASHCRISQLLFFGGSHDLWYLHKRKSSFLKSIEANHQLNELNTKWISNLLVNLLFKKMMLSKKKTVTMTTSLDHKYIQTTWTNMYPRHCYKLISIIISSFEWQGQSFYNTFVIIFFRYSFFSLLFQVKFTIICGFWLRSTNITVVWCWEQQVLCVIKYICSKELFPASH